MSKIFVLYGINGVGKDAIAAALQRENSEIVIVTVSRLVMYHLGIIRDFSYNLSINESAYRELEKTSSERKEEVSNTLCFETIASLSENGKIVLCLSHLAISKRYGKNNWTCKPSSPSKWINSANGLIHVTADPEDVLIWRKNDKRERVNCIKEIQEQQITTTNEWEKIINNTQVPYITVLNKNHQKRKAVRAIERFIFQNSRKED